MEKRISKRIRGISPTKLTPHITIRRHKLKRKEERLNSDPTNTQTQAPSSSTSFKNYREQKSSESDAEDINLVKRKAYTSNHNSSVVIASPKFSLVRRHSVGNYSFIFDDSKENLNNETDTEASFRSASNTSINIPEVEDSIFTDDSSTEDFSEEEIPETTMAMATIKEPLPKYTSQLSRRELELFVSTFNIWSTQRKLTDDIKKIQFQLAISNKVAQQWFNINQAIVIDNDITWDNFIKIFFETCPTENTDDELSFSEIISMTQGRTEKATIFIQKIRYLFGKEWGKYPEKDIVQGMVKQLNINTRRYIECRGLPDSYTDLMKIIQQYEAKGGTKELDEIVIKTERVQFATQVEPEINMEMKEISDSLHKISAFMSREHAASGYTKMPNTNPFVDTNAFTATTNTFKNGNSGYEQYNSREHGSGRGGGRGVNFNHYQSQGRNRDFRNLPKCWTCGKTGHVQATCYYNNGQQQWSGYTNSQESKRNNTAARQQWSGEPKQTGFLGNYHGRGN